MAHILPETPLTIFPSEVLKVYRSLQSLPDTFYIWHHLAPWQAEAPDFLVISYNKQVLLVKVSSSPARLAVPAIQSLLFDLEQPQLGAAESQVLVSFTKQLQLPKEQAIGILIVFPNIPHKQVLSARKNCGEGELAWAGKELLTANSGIAWEDYLPQTPMDEEWIWKVRHCFSPEVVIPPEMTVRSPVERMLEAGLTDYLLDYDQEKVLKQDMDLFPEGEVVSNDLRLNILKGSAGSGKTLVLLYRLRLLYHYYPKKRYLVLTHNRPLNYDMQARFYKLMGYLPENIEWHTFNGWCYKHWPVSERWVEPLSLQDRLSLVENIWREHLQNSPLTPKMLLEEIDWVKDHPPMDQDTYLSIERRGRGFGLSIEQREQVFRAMQAYQRTLERMGSCDWGDIPQGIWRFMEEGKFAESLYDVILVDEAQFFAPLWFHILQRILNPKNGHFFIAADPTQGFLGRGGSWKSVGLEARGRTHSLQRSYRTTREIMQFATMFYRSRLSDPQDEEVLLPDLLNMPRGVFPQLIPLSSIQDEIVRLANEVANFVRQGMPKNHLLLLHSNWRGVKSLIHHINERLGKDAARDPKEGYPGDYVRVTTLNAGAGLESPIVFLAGLRDLFEEEQSLRLSDTERERLIRENTQKLYMAITRAGQRLVLSYVGELPSELESMFKMG